ncbi:MAG: hypothetical protein KGJ40_06290 [candidate division NC10 bacterium]|nr:hypothetical protein [candidate division NC10 bacterium]MDE2485417.1 hypothetical protein [candidate division NC10 bacterium]
MLKSMRAYIKGLVILAFIGTIFLVWRSRSASGPGGPSPTAQPGLSSWTGQQESPGASWVGRWTVFTDPNEHAFTIDVPEGWSVQGGMRRFSATVVSPWLVAISPNRGIELFFSHPDLRIYIVPTQWTQMQGIREGMVLPDQSVAQRYLPGATFAGQWGAARIAQSCTGVSPKGTATLPSPRISNDFAAAGIRLSVSAGEASFACNLRGAPSIGYVSAATTLVQSQGGAVWFVWPVVGFIASAQQASQAAMLLSHVVGSFAKDQNWEARQGQTNLAVSRIQSETQQVVSQLIHDRFQNASASQAHVWEGWDRSFQGQQPYRIPGTEDVRRLETHPHWWKMPNGGEVWTNDANPPDPYAREMMPEPLR